MIKVKFANNVQREEDVLSRDITINEVLEHFSTSSGNSTSINGMLLNPDELNKPISEFVPQDAEVVYVNSLRKTDHN